jgi:CubicO group peptidase (beta-lactamase class C family)
LKPAVLVAAIAFALPGLPVRAASQEPRIDSIFAAFSRDESPGCAVAAARNGERLFAAGYGSASLEHHVPISPRTRFYAASVSKQFTAYAVALLVAQGRLSLDDDVRRWLPEVPDLDARITVRHLVHHTSGLRDYFGLLAIAGWPSDGPITEAQFLDLVSRQRALNFTPGTQYLYSNTGYVLLAILVQRATGQSLRQFADEQIFIPLGMRSTGFRDDHARLVPDLALAYAMQDGEWKLSVPGFDVVGDGGLYTTVEDLLLWDRHFLEPGERAKVVARMQQRGSLDNGSAIAYAFGLTLTGYRNAPAIAHGGSYGGYRTYLMRFPEQRAAVAVLCNAATANPAVLAQRVADVVLDAELAPPTAAPPRPTGAPAAAPADPAPDPQATSQLDPRTLAALTGTYYSDELDVTWHIIAENGALVVRRRALPDLPLVARGGDRFTLRSNTLSFTRTADGRVTGFTLAAGRVTGLRFTVAR